MVDSASNGRHRHFQSTPALACRIGRGHFRRSGRSARVGHPAHLRRVRWRHLRSRGSRSGSTGAGRFSACSPRSRSSPICPTSRVPPCRSRSLVTRFCAREAFAWEAGFCSTSLAPTSTSWSAGSIAISWWHAAHFTIEDRPSLIFFPTSLSVSCVSPTKSFRRTPWRRRSPSPRFQKHEPPPLFAVRVQQLSRPRRSGESGSGHLPGLPPASLRVRARALLPVHQLSRGASLQPAGPTSRLPIAGRSTRPSARSSFRTSI